MNNKGWGLRAELVVVIVFLMCLIISTIGLNKLGLIGGNEDDNKIPFTNNIEVYEKMESKLIDSASMYVNNYYGGNNIKDELTIRYTTLYYYNYIDKLKDNSDNECSGYVEVKNINANLIYFPYLKCRGYKTNGYVSSKDW